MKRLPWIIAIGVALGALAGLGQTGCVIEPGQPVGSVEGCAPPAELPAMQRACDGQCAPASWRLYGQCGLSHYVAIYCSCGDGVEYQVSADGNQVVLTPMDPNGAGGLQ